MNLRAMHDLVRYVDKPDLGLRIRVARGIGPTYFESRAPAGCLWVAVAVFLGAVVVIEKPPHATLIVVALLGLVPVFFWLERIIPALLAFYGLGRCRARIDHKLSVTEPRDGYFRSYWDIGGDKPLELDHPQHFHTLVSQATERWIVDIPSEGGVRGIEAGLVRRLDDGTPELILPGVTWCEYDPYTNTVKPW